MKWTETRTVGGVTVTRTVECSDGLLDRPGAAFIREWITGFMVRGVADFPTPKGVTPTLAGRKEGTP